jgi:ubiquinone/menaquinone biosynthesis C-methylase UbiE
VKTSPLLNFLLFPFRALFIPEESKWGLLSLRDERMMAVASYCAGKVLDIGCGPGNYFVQHFIGTSNGLGIDIYPYEGVENVVDDMSHLPFEDNSYDTVTLIAVGGHIPKPNRVAEFKEFARILKPAGKLIMTEGEPITQWINHKWYSIFYAILGKKDMDSERGMDAEEEYCMPYHEIVQYLNTSPLRFRQQVKFQWGLNNIYIAEKANEP